MYPGSEDLPPPLALLPLDMIAKGQDKTIAVEVRTRERLTLNGSEDLRRIAYHVGELPGWDFELVVTHPRPRKAR